MRVRPLLVAGACSVLLTGTFAQQRLPGARLVQASRITMPGLVDSNVPIAWELVDGTWRMLALTSFAGVPSRLSGAGLEHLQSDGPIAIADHPGHGIWIESIVPDDTGALYGYYHHERPAEACGRLDRSVPQIGSMRSTDHGATWQDLGVLLEAFPDSVACTSANRYVLGGVGDLSAILDATSTDLLLFFSQYPKTASEQGIAVARLAWADRDAPAGRAMIWRDGAWIPSGSGPSPSGTPLVPPTQAWHDGNTAVDAFWGPSVHWNDYLEQYVMLMNRARDELFNNEGIYVAYSRTLSDPRGWSAPQKLMNRGGWYPQVAGLEPQAGTDKRAGRRARFFLTGRSDYYIEFQR